MRQKYTLKVYYCPPSKDTVLSRFCGNRFFIAASPEPIAYRRIKGNRPPRAHRRSRGIALLIVNLGAGRGWEVSTMPRPLYPRE
jgi:hypothetical protein